MVKSNAQRCRESRDRRRARGPQYHIDERARSAVRYVPSAQLTPEARAERNLKGKQSMALQRAALAPPRKRMVADPAPGSVADGPAADLAAHLAAHLAADLAADPAAGPAVDLAVDPTTGHAAAPAAALNPSTSTDAVCTRLQAILLGCSNAK